MENNHMENQSQQAQGQAKVAIDCYLALISYW